MATAKKKQRGRPKGHRLSEETKQRIADGVRGTHARRTAESLLYRAASRHGEPI
ncbi:MAG: hypothetical protein H0W30_16065 [Gemmatimonadaceae bacterium]|nr:hypothetical protein [Gemmatimonadaceae bacterium]